MEKKTTIKSYKGFDRDLKKVFFFDKWIDIKGFGDPERAEELLKILKG